MSQPIQLVVVESKGVPGALSLRLLGDEEGSGVKLKLALFVAGYEAGDELVLVPAEQFSGDGL